MFEMARALITPTAVQALLWEMLLDKLQTHYTPKPSKITSHHAVHQKDQVEGKSIKAHIMVELAEHSKEGIRRASRSPITQKPIPVVAEMAEHSEEIPEVSCPLTMQEPIPVTAETAEHSTGEILGAGGPPTTREPVPVNHDDISINPICKEDSTGREKLEHGKFEVRLARVGQAFQRLSSTPGKEGSPKVLQCIWSSSHQRQLPN